MNFFLKCLPFFRGQLMTDIPDPDPQHCLYVANGTLRKGVLLGEIHLGISYLVNLAKDVGLARFQIFFT
jgi:hypothetical protein